jgi:Flp pilus assembly protein TadG
MRQNKEESGYIIVTVAVLLIVLLAFTALAVDIGAMFAARTQSQRAADAAALAGAYTFIQNPSLADQPLRAQTYAKKVATAAMVMGRQLTDADVPTPLVDLANRRVIVTIGRTEPTFFAKALSFNGVSVGVTATAEAARDAVAQSCVKPLFIPNNVLLASTDICTACMQPDMWLVDATTGPPYNPTMYAMQQAAAGALLTLYPGAASGAISPSQYYLIKFPGNNGAADVENAIGSCSSPVQFKCLDMYDVETGLKKGPVVAGFTSDTPHLLNDPPDTWSSTGVYLIHGTTPYTTSQQLISVPIAHLCTYCTNPPNPQKPGEFPSGQGGGGAGVSLTIVGFAQIFVNDVQNGSAQVTAHLVNVAGCGDTSAGGGGGPTGAGANSLPLRLVRVP